MGSFADAVSVVHQHADVAARDRAGRGPVRPLLRLVSGPQIDIEVHGPHRAEDSCLVGARAAVIADRDVFSPPGVELLGDAEVGLSGVELFDRQPEQLRDEVCLSCQGGVVDLGAAAIEVVDEELPYRLAGDRILVNHLRGC